MDYNRIAATCKRLIDKNGRSINLFKLSADNADPLKPWRGAGVQTLIEPVSTKAVFAIGNTAIPTESRGLAFDWVDNDLLRITRHVCLVSAIGLPALEDYKIAKDGNAKNWDIIWGQCLQPGDTRLLYCFGLKE